MATSVSNVSYEEQASFALLTSEVAVILGAHGIPVTLRLELVDCPEAIPVVQAFGDAVQIDVHDEPGAVLANARKREPVAILVHVRSAERLLDFLQEDGAMVGVVVFDPDGHESNSAALRAKGVMDVVTELASRDLEIVLRKAFDFRALLLLELDHRCESKRLHQREHDLLGATPDQLSDDLEVFQPPPLPVGPMSAYNLEEASEAFETAYISRVQQLCSSSREAAQVLGVSPATLSRRQKKEDA